MLLSQEKLLLIKTKANLYKKVEQTIKQLHPYEVPEIIQIPIVKGSEEYLGWVEEDVGFLALEGVFEDGVVVLNFIPCYP